MAAIGGFMPYGGFRNVYNGARFLSSDRSSPRLLKISTVGLKFWFLANQGMKMSDMDQRAQAQAQAQEQSSSDTNSEKKIGSSNQSPVPGPSGSSNFPPDWLKWIFGTFLTVVVPYLKKRLSTIEDQVEAVLDVADNVVDTIDNIAEAVEDAASDIGDNLKAGKLKDAALYVENISREISEKADVVEEIIDKVDDMREKVEDMLEGDDGKEKAVGKESQAK